MRDSRAGDGAAVPDHSDACSYPNLRHLRLLEAADRQGSLTAAAETILISQPAASQAITRLNSQFGGKLLERRGNGVFATERGKIVVRRARRVLDVIRSYSQTGPRRGRGGRKPGIQDLENHFTLSHVRAVSAVGRMGSFSAAARSLGQTEPNIQRAARDVEGIVGLKLFTGGVKGMQLTEAGQALARTMNLILKELDSAFEELREYEGAYDGRLLIGTLPLVRSTIIPKTVVALSKIYSDATIGVLDGTYEDQRQALESGSIDVLVGALRVGEGNGTLVGEALFSDQLSIVARKGHPLAAREHISFEDLQAFPWVLPRPGTPTRSLFDRLVESKSLPRDTRGCIETGSLVALRGILLEADYLTIISPRQIEQELQVGMLEVLPVPLEGSNRPIGVTVRANWQPTRLQKDFLVLLREIASDQTA